MSKKYINPSNYDTAEEFWDAVDRNADRDEQEAQAADDAWSEREEEDV